HQPRIIGGMTFDPQRHTACFVALGPNDPPGLRFPPSGLTMRFRSPVQEVFARVQFRSAVTMTAFNGAVSVGTATTSGPSPAVLHLAAAGITHVVLRSKDELSV